MKHITKKHIKTLLVSFLYLFVLTANVFSQGATVPFITYEAEAGKLEGGAKVVSVGVWPNYKTAEVESSGRKNVELSTTGASVSWTTTEQTNTIVVRVSLPDAPIGGGISGTLNLYVDDVFRQAISCTSKHAWLYGENPSFENNNPTLGNPKRFFDSFRAFISGDPVPAGSTITLKKDADNTAPYYKIDFVFLENVGPPLTQPVNTLSVTSYGAIPNDDLEDSQAFKNCIAACQSQKKGMWIPAGVFHTKGIITARGISIYGAGMWYTTNYRIIGERHKWDLYNCNIQDIYFYNPQTARDVIAEGHDYGMTVQGDLGWTVQRVWNHHLMFWCSGTDGTIKDCRSLESFGDGINLNNSNVIQKPDYAGIRLTAQNNFILGAGDDGFAINSQNGGGVEFNMVDTKIINNTSVAIVWANGLRVAGGRNSLIQNNLILDPCDRSGIFVGTFGTTGNPCESVLVKDNLVLRGTGARNVGSGLGGITVDDNATATIMDNTIIDSPDLGINLLDCNVTFSGNKVINPALHGFLVKLGKTGKGVFTNNTVTGLKNGMRPFVNESPTTFTATLTGNSWQATSIEDNLESNTANKSEMVTLFPNPISADEILTIHLKEENFPKLQIFNLNGQVVYFSNLKGESSMNLSLKGILKSGVYIVSLSSDKLVVNQKLIIK